MPLTAAEAQVWLPVYQTKFDKACSYLALFNQRLEDKHTRYRRAYKANQKSWRYTLRIQMATMQGMRNMYYMYAQRCKRDIEYMQRVLSEAGLDVSSYELLEVEESVL